jgi:hypothetical protein
MIDKALQISRAHAQIAVDIGGGMAAGFGALFDASMAFAATAAGNQVATATAMMSAKSPEAAADLQRAYLSHALQAAGALAARIAVVCDAAAKRFEAPAE